MLGRDPPPALAPCTLADGAGLRLSKCEPEASRRWRAASPESKGVCEGTPLALPGRRLTASCTTALVRHGSRFASLAGCSAQLMREFVGDTPTPPAGRCAPAPRSGCVLPLPASPWGWRGCYSRGVITEPELIEAPSERGPVRALFHAPRPGRPVVAMVGGFDGGFDGPADGIFAVLAADLGEHGIGALRVDFRDRRSPGVVDDGACDVRAAMAEVRRRGGQRFALLGHSFGAAVMITVAAEDEDVVAVVALSTQTVGVEGTPRIAPRPLLLVHGLEDIRLPPACSRYVYSIAGEPKELVLLEGTRHSLRQRKDDLRGLVVDWLVEKLAAYV